MIFLNNLENNNLSPINEINMARTNGMCVSVDPSPNENYGKIAYFKAYNNSIPDKNKININYDLLADFNNVKDNREVRFQDRYNWDDDFAEDFY